LRKITLFERFFDGLIKHIVTVPTAAWLSAYTFADLVCTVDQELIDIAANLARRRHDRRSGC